MKSIVLIAVMLVGITVLSMAMTIGFCVSTLSNPYFVPFQSGAQAAAKLLGINLIFLNANNSNSTELNEVEDLIQRKVDAIVLDPTDSEALVPAVIAANKAGIPVIDIDRVVYGGKVAWFMGCNNVEYGEMEAQSAAELLNGKGNIVILTGIPGASATRDRDKGIDEVLSKYPDIKVVARQTAQFDKATAMSVMESILLAHPDINAVIAENDEMALGAIQAIKTMGRSGIIVIGGDGILEGLEAVKDGTETVDVALVDQPYTIAGLGVIAAYLTVRGVTLEPNTLGVKLVAVTKANVDQYIKLVEQGF
ncbi:MAG: substrate-binding domain-containing protein [Candidatus Parvarchaeota archaeon]|nr:substrate-binding domain-containing protein [Candidatus Jingweiarchaeum tengchongense]